MGDLMIAIGIVREVENTNSDYIKDGNHLKDQPYDGLRVRVELKGRDFPKKWKNLPWAFPLLPKTFQSIPKEGEAVLVLYDGMPNSQRYYIGPIISQPQFNTECEYDNASSLLTTSDSKPLKKISNDARTIGSFPRSSDVAIIGRGEEDIILRHDTNGKHVDESEIQLRAGIRQWAKDNSYDLVGSVIFNDQDPAYIQMKYKRGLSKKKDMDANSIINLVADRINIMSNKDNEISDKIHDKESMIENKDMDSVMEKLHQVPKGDKLVELLDIMKGCIMHHVHPWPGMEQCGDWDGYIEQLEKYDIKEILSKYVRIS